MKDLFYYINIMNFGGIDKRITLESSLYSLPESELNQIINGYLIRIKIDYKLFNEINRLLYGGDKNEN